MTDDKNRPSLADQHWRAQLRARNADALASDLQDAVRAGNAWRFNILLKLDFDSSAYDPAVRAALEHKRHDMFFALRERQEKSGGHANLQDYACIAARADDVLLLGHLVEEKGVRIDLYNGELLREAAQAGSLGSVNYLLSAGADPGLQGGAAIRNAAEKGHVAVLESMFAKGADIKAFGPEALRAAAESNQPSAAEFLLKAGTPPEASAQALVAAARHGHVDVLRVMLANGMTAGQGDSIALREAVKGDQYAAADFLLKAGADIDADGGEALRHAVTFRDTAAVKWLLDNGACTSFPHGRETPLMRAAWGGDREVLELLLAAGADPSAQQYGAIRVARERKEKPCARLLYAAVKKNLALEKQKKLAEFAEAFGDAYSVEDLRSRKGASGECGLLIAAQTGAFDKILAKAEGRLEPSDLYHPDDGVDTVMSHLKRHKSLGQFFEADLWQGRGDAFLEACLQLPPALQKRVNSHAIVARINQREMQKKMRNAASRPPKL